MSEKPVNLNKVRKARAKTARRQRADENAVKFGRTKGQKAAEKAQNAQVVRLLDGAKRTP